MPQKRPERRVRLDRLKKLVQPRLATVSVGADAEAHHRETATVMDLFSKAKPKNPEEPPKESVLAAMRKVADGGSDHAKLLTVISLRKVKVLGPKSIAWLKAKAEKSPNRRIREEARDALEEVSNRPN